MKEVLYALNFLITQAFFIASLGMLTFQGVLLFNLIFSNGKVYPVEGLGIFFMEAFFFSASIIIGILKSIYYKYVYALSDLNRLLVMALYLVIPSYYFMGSYLITNTFFLEYSKICDIVIKFISSLLIAILFFVELREIAQYNE